MKEMGNFSEEERLAERQHLVARIDLLDKVATSEKFSHSEAFSIQEEMDEEKRKLFDISTNDENIARIEESLEDHEMMYEMSEGEYAVTLDSILTPWGEIPKWKDLTPEIKKELLRIKSENPWIQDSGYESEE